MALVSKFVDINYFGIKSSARKELFIQEPTTNNLIELTESLELIKLENGKQQCIFRKTNTIDSYT